MSTALRWTPLAAGGCRQLERMALPRVGGWRHLWFPASFALIEHPVAGIGLFDCGYAPRVVELMRHWPERALGVVTPLTLHPASAPLAQLVARGIGADEVRWIFLSHFHVDHTGALRDFPRAEIIASRLAWEAVRSLRGLAALRRAVFPELLPEDIGVRLRLLDCARSPGDLLADGVRVFDDESVLALPLPGHAAGQCGLLLRPAGAAPVFLIADGAWQSRQLVDGAAPSVLTRPIHDDWAALRRTLVDLAALRRAQPDWTFLPTHCSATLRSLGVQMPEEKMP